jgi:four helix bundle protein
MSEPALNRKFVEMMQLMNIYLNHFPKHEKYALCNQIRNTAYDVYNLITEGQKRYYKKTTLSALDIAHETLRMQVYLANELGYFSFKDGKSCGPAKATQRYLVISKQVDELGRMIGGWIKKIKEQNQW